MKSGFANVRYALYKTGVIKVRYRFVDDATVEYLRGNRRKAHTVTVFNQIYPYHTKRAAYAALVRVLRGQVTRKRRELAKLEAAYDKARLLSKKMPGYRPERPWRR